MVLTDEQVRAVVEALGGADALDALWVFGSEATGSAGPRSDVDLAALFSGERGGAQVYETARTVASVLGREVDLVDLRRASPVLAMQALRRGTLVHDGHRARRIAFEAGLPARYEDVVRLRAPAERALLARMHGRA